MSQSIHEEEPLLGDTSHPEDNYAIADEEEDTDNYINNNNDNNANSFRNDIEQGPNELPADASSLSSLGTVGRPVVSFLRSTFGFNKAPFSLLFVATYVAIILLSYLVQTKNPEVESSSYPEKYLSDAWMDLQEISREFHPYFSHANDRVHDYILKQVTEITLRSEKGYIKFDDDVRKVFFQDNDVFNPNIIGRVNYFEANNVLVKIQGSDPSLDAVLLSAHYDSVPTAYGTTDDGAGIASMLSILRFYADENTPRPLRSIVFNFNNDEEFGLLGAEAFFYHPWSQNVTVFLNLEGTGAGGRAILFRASDYGVAKHFSAASSPHASSIFQQGFSDGLVKSETDYKVYTKKGLRGLDVAFYKPRNLYHTRRDSIRGSTKGALSHMFTNALDVTQSLADAPENDFNSSPDDTKPAVFFDVFGAFLVMIPLSLLFKIHVLGLVAGMLVVSLLFAVVVKTGSWKIGLKGWLRGIVSLIISTTVTYFVALWIEGTNELIVVSSFFSPFFLLLSVFLITNYIILSLGSFVRPIPDQKLVIFLESFVVLWVLMVISTLHITRRKATGEFPITIVYYLYTTAVVLGLLGTLVVKSDTVVTERNHSLDSHSTTASKLKHVARKSLSFDWSLQYILVVPVGFYILYSSVLLVFEALHHNALEGTSGASTVFTVLTYGSVAVGFLVLPFIHRLHVLVEVLLLLITIVGAVLTFFPFPLSHESPMKIRFLQTVDLDNMSGPDGTPKAEVSILARTGYGYKVLSDFPSVKAGNLAVTCTPYGSNDNEVCSYEGPRPWVISDKSRDTAADYGEWLNVTVVRNHTDYKFKKYPYKATDMGVNKGDSDEDDGDFGPFGGEIRIEAKENRVCEIRFNTTTFNSFDGTPSPVRIVAVHHDNELNGSKDNHTDSNPPDVLKWYKGINDLTIHKLNWTQPEYHLEFQWIPRWYEAQNGQHTMGENGAEQLKLIKENGVDKRSLGLQIACYWAEYDVDSVVGDELIRKVPAYDEALEYGPSWVSWTNWNKGLVEVTKYIEI